ncbi:RNA polymerase sigma factor [Chitinophaga agrisoli]|nr:sigma-70 family RNA polymerase sigma factor [Chitinophaga agrisoli]
MQTNVNYNERELLLLIAGGDEQAFAAVFHHYRNNIYRTAYRLTDSATTAEDVLQEVFLAIWMNRAALPEIGNFPAYLLTIARNQIINSFKKACRQQDAVLALSGMPALNTTDPDQRLQEQEYDKLLQQAVAMLPPRQAEVYRMIKIEGLSRFQAAQQLQVSPETVKTHMELAIKKIRAFCLAHIGLQLLWMVITRLF